MSKVKLADVVERSSGGGTPARDVASFWNGPIPWATVKDFKDGVRRLSSVQESITRLGLNSSSANLIPSGTPILCMRMGVGRVATAPFAVAINQDLRALFVGADFDPDFVVWAIDGIRSQIENEAIGSTVKGISVDRLMSFEILDAALPEQSKIAEVLSAVDSAIAQTEALTFKQQRIKTGLMQDLLTRGIDEHGQLRCETTHAFKDSPLGRIPVEWDATTIGARCQVKRGASPRPIQDPKWWGATAGWVRISDVTSARKYLRTTTQRLSVAGVANSVLLQSGEVILSICATIGRPIITTYPVCIHDGFVWFDGLSDEVDREWFYYYLQSREDQLAASRQVGTQGNLNTNIVSGTEFLVPTSKIEQTKIAQILATADRILDDHIASREKLLALKTALMQDLLTGKVRVTPLLQQAEEAVSA